MATSGYYDEIAKIEQLRRDRLAQVRKRITKKVPSAEMPRVSPVVVKHYFRKLPGRRSWSH